MDLLLGVPSLWIDIVVIAQVPETLKASTVISFATGQRSRVAVCLVVAFG